MLPPPPAPTGTVPECRSYVLPSTAVKRTIQHNVAVPLLEERITYKVVKKIVTRPKEVVKVVPVILKKEVVQFKEVVTDEIIEVPKPFRVEQKVYVPNYVDTPVSTVVAQKYGSTFAQQGSKNVECCVYEPEIIYQDVYVPKVEGNNLVISGSYRTLKPVNELSKAHWNALIFKLNPHMDKDKDWEHFPLHRDEDNHVLSYAEGEAVGEPLSALEPALTQTDSARHASRTQDSRPTSEAVNHSSSFNNMSCGSLTEMSRRGFEYLPRPFRACSGREEHRSSNALSEGSISDFASQSYSERDSTLYRHRTSVSQLTSPLREVSAFASTMCSLTSCLNRNRKPSVAADEDGTVYSTVEPQSYRATDMTGAEADGLLCKKEGYPAFDQAPEHRLNTNYVGEVVRTLNGPRVLLAPAPISERCI